MFLLKVKTENLVKLKRQWIHIAFIYWKHRCGRNLLLSMGTFLWCTLERFLGSKGRKRLKITSKNLYI